MNKVIVGVISDTHLTSPEEKFANLIKEHFSHCDCIIHAGDIVDDDILTIIDKPLYAVRGNMDFSSKLPIKRTVTIMNKKIGVIHGYGHPDGIQLRIKKEFDEVDCIVYGHTHASSCEVIEGVIFFNPGSPFDNRHSSKKSVGYLEIDENGIKCVIKEL